MTRLKVIAITQARSGSSRLPNKVLKKINNTSLLEIHIRRIIKSKLINELVVATTNNENDDEIVEICEMMNVSYYRGSENNVLDRFYNAAKSRNPALIVRLTSDCPLIDPMLIDEVINFSIKNDLDYCSNTFIEDFPDGQDVEVMKFSALEYAWKNADKRYQKEHVTPYIRENSTFMKGNIFLSDNFKSFKNYGAVRLTVDEQKDFEVISQLISELGTEKSWLDYADFYRDNENISKINQGIKRNEGFKKI